MDGWVVIGTKLDTKQLEKDLKNEKRRLSDFQKENEKLAKQKVKAEVDLKGYEQAKKQINEITKEALKSALTEQESARIIETKNRQLENLNNEYSKELTAVDNINKKIASNNNQIELTKNSVEELNQKLNKSKGFENIGKQINNANSAMGKVIKKVGKWALAVFSVRSAYSFIRNAISTVTQYNSQMATDIEYMRYALANSLAPVINYIINLAKTLLAYINYIFKAWFGKDLFASAKDWEKAKKASAGVAKNTEKIEKSLQSAGFDELEVLQSQSQTSAGDGGVGFEAPSFDLTDFKDIKIPKWIQWIADHKDLFKIIGEGLAILFGASLLAKVAKAFGAISQFSGALAGIPTAIMIALAVIGVTEAIKKVRELEDAIKKVNKQYDDLHKQEETGAKTSKYIADEVERKIKANELEADSIQVVVNGAKERLEMQKNTIDNYNKEMETMGIWEQLTTNNYQLYKQRVIDTIKTSEEEIGILLKVGESFDFNNEKMQEVGLTTEDIKKEIETHIQKIQDLNGNINKNDEEYQKNIDKINQLKGTLNDITQKEMQQEIDKLEQRNQKINKNSEEYQKNIDKIKSLKEKIKELDKTEANVIINADTKEAEKKAGNFFENLANSVTGIIDAGVSLFSKGAKSLVSEVKSLWSKHADGGIINLPGRGVQIGPRDIGGEAGAEGVIPLTKEQQMEILGQAIGKYVTINLTNITKLDNRQINRNQATVSAQNDFTYNR